MNPFQCTFMNILVLLLSFRTFSVTIYNGKEIKDLIETTTTNFADDLLHWTISNSAATPLTFLCYGVPFFGSYSVFSNGAYVEREYKYLPQHDMLAYKIWFIFIGPWASGEGFSITFSSGTASTTFNYQNTQATFYASTFTTPHCGTVYNELNDLLVTGKIPHAGSFLRIRITSNLQSPSIGSLFVFKDIYIRFANSSSPITTEHCISSDHVRGLSYPMNNLCPCQRIKYFNSTNNVCQNCHANCDLCFGQSASECFGCQTGYYFDGNTCVSCHSSCSYCHGTTDRECDACAPGKFLLDHACVSSCTSPFLLASGGYYCSYPCQDNEYLYPDGSCYTTCDSRFTTTIVNYKQLCSTTCTGAQIMYYNGVCSSTPCPYPLVMNKYGAFQVCEYPCPSGQIVYSDGTCASTCVFPFKSQPYGSFSVCQVPCSSSSDFSYYWENTCRNTCPSPLQQRTVYGVQVCDPPDCGAKFCDLCQTGNVCPDFYYCNITSPSGKFCMPGFNYQLNVMLLKTLPNSYVLSANVIPNEGIVPGINDTLLFHLQNFQLGSDYTTKIEKLGTASFMIYVYALSSLNRSIAVGSFHYGPLSLGLKASLTLPRLTFVPGATQGLAQKVEFGSNIIFFVFAAIILVCVLRGKLSVIWSTLPATQYIFYLRYLNVDYLYHTQLYLDSLNYYDILIGHDANKPSNSPDLIDSLPKRYFTLNYEPDFLYNCGQLILQLIIIIFTLIFAAIILRFVRFSGRGVIIYKAFTALRKAFKWNGFIRHAMLFTLPFTTASVIQIYDGIFDQKMLSFNLFLSIVTLLLFLITIYKMFTYVNRVPKGKAERVIFAKRYGTLWEGLELESFTRYYHWIVTFRGCVLVYMCLFFDLFPYVQISVLITYQCGILALFIKGFTLREVFMDKNQNKATFAEECCLLLVKAAILLFLIMQEKGVTDGTIIFFGWVIIVPAALTQIIQTTYCLSDQIIQQKPLLEMIKRTLAKNAPKKSKKIRRLNNPRRNSFIENMASEEQTL